MALFVCVGAVAAYVVGEGDTPPLLSWLLQLPLRCLARLTCCAEFLCGIAVAAMAAAIPAAFVLHLLGLAP